ncbi:MAG: flagellar filament outer layer protein FlaA [Treponemataceae bacterium]|nr:flagellar filament outer layer protein FlaA [Treponemataceae bacterium]
MKKIVALFTILAVFTAAFAQQSTYSNDPSTDADSAQQSLREISLDLFEREGSWNCHISPDAGIITGRLFDGGPFSDLEPEGRAEETKLPEEVKDTPNEHMYGVKVEFFHRGVNSFFITAARPIPIEGIAKTVSVWVAGRNQAHSLTLLVQDYFGNSFELFMGSLAFSGWRKLTVTVPVSPDGKRGIVQQSPFWGERPGLRIVGFRVDCDPETAFGQYFMYLDDLRAVTDLYAVENLDADDPVDNW